MQYTTAKCALIIVIILLSICVIYRQTRKSCTISPLYEESFTVESPPVSGTASIPKPVKSDKIALPTVAQSAIGGQDRPLAAAALNSTQSSSSAVLPVPTLDPASLDILSDVGYDSMFDTKIAPAWSTNPSVIQLDGAVIQQPLKLLNSAGKFPNTSLTKPAIQNTVNLPGLARVDSRGMAPFTNLIEGTQRNYLTAQNFWEYAYRYPIVPPEGVAPLGANYADGAIYCQNPLIETKILSANKDGGQPLPQNTFFRPT